ncbi:MAG TPA: protein kinase [Pyrinomonadaceae bacterium]|nr:protein kinase [Pyrinomonadaceae bacterium]
MTLAANTLLGRYEIISLLGKGGMGEVYLARDTQLDRMVALKVLAEEFAENERGMQRFMQEARAASALNHPNIITIHEIGETDSVHFIATEFIDGITLRERLRQGRMSVKEALDTGAQIASALIAAHASGIVHRDIKPENIMLRRDQLVKVLDFGLCKLIESKAFEPTSSTLGYSTDPGVVMGTAFYMSPEQTRGADIDGRTDIWSLGCVLYEMVANRSPFEGGSQGEVIVSILEREPPPLASFASEVPEAFEWIGLKTLRKDREERYQSARELFADLRSLKQRLDFSVAFPKASVPQVSGGTTISVTSGSLRAVEEEGRGRTRRTDEIETGRMTVASQRVEEGKRKESWKTVLALSSIILLLGAISFGVYKYWGQRGAVSSSNSMKISRLTATGKATRAVVSPDGKYVVHVINDAGRQSLWVRQVATTSNVQIVPPADVTYRGLTFTPDGSYVNYVVQERNNPIQILYQVPALGGAPKKILVDIDTPVTFSPDGSRLAYLRRSRSEGEDVLFVANADGSNERRLASRTGTQFFGVVGAGGPSWSPDGNMIACAAGTNSGGRSMSVVEISVADGTERVVTGQSWLDVGRVAWLPDGSGLVVAATEQGATTSQLWLLAYPGGAVRRITNDLNDYRDLSLTDDSNTIAAVQSEGRINTWVSPANESTARAQQITKGVGGYDGVRGLSWSPDGRLAYVSRVSGSQDVWVMNADGSEQKQLTTVATRADVYPSVCGDGSYIVFTSNRLGNSNIWRIGLDGSNPKQLTSGSGEEFPACSPDGRWVVYTSTGSSKFTLWKVSIEGGEPVQLTEKLSQWPTISPDGKLIACWLREDTGMPWRIGVIPADGGEPLKVLEVPTSANAAIPVRWTSDGRMLTFVDTHEGVSNVWGIAIDGGAAKQLTDFKSDQIFFFDWSRDGRQLALARGDINNDVVLISNFK